MLGPLRSPPFFRFICAQMWCRGVLCLPRSPPLRIWPSGFICANVGPQGLLVVRLPAPFVPHSTSLGPTMATRVLSAPVPVSAPPTSLDECFFFYLLGVGLPCLSIFCQFWLCEKAQCVYLCRHLGSLTRISYDLARSWLPGDFQIETFMTSMPK